MSTIGSLSLCRLLLRVGLVDRFRCVMFAGLIRRDEPAHRRRSRSRSRFPGGLASFTDPQTHGTATVVAVLARDSREPSGA